MKVREAIKMLERMAGGSIDNRVAIASFVILISLAP